MSPDARAMGINEALRALTNLKGVRKTECMAAVAALLCPICAGSGHVGNAADRVYECHDCGQTGLCPPHIKPCPGCGGIGRGLAACCGTCKGTGLDPEHHGEGFTPDLRARQGRAAHDRGD